MTHKKERPMLAKDIMNTNVITANADASVSDVVKIITEHQISGTPIINKEGKLVGIVTERDLLLQNELIASVADIMTKEVITVSEDRPVDEISALLLDHSIKRIVVTRDNAVVGIVSRQDILKSKIKQGYYL
jgi:CBS domain-containing protein